MISGPVDRFLIHAQPVIIEADSYQSRERKYLRPIPVADRVTCCA